MIEDDSILEEQVRYYRARAQEYDQWFLREGRYYLGEEHQAQWDAEVQEVRRALNRVPLWGSVLEFACGTGWWTQELAHHPVHITAIDTSPEVIERNKGRVGDTGIEYIQADIFRWHPPTTYDLVFFGFWISHVPPGRFESFWRLVGQCLRPGGRVFFVDNRLLPGKGEDERSERLSRWIESRELNDGRRFEIVKTYYEPNELEASLEHLGWSGRIAQTASFFIWGDLRRSADG